MWNVYRKDLVSSIEKLGNEEGNDQVNGEIIICFYI